MSSKPSLLISFGGNALNVPESFQSHKKGEFEIARKSMESVIDLIEEGYEKIILSHGNGPQVGKIFLQQELTQNEFPGKTTLDVCVADSQGRIGYILQNVFDNVCQQRGIDKRSFAVITQAVVDPDDPAFKKPAKPIGVSYSKSDCEKLSKEHGWEFTENSKGIFKRVVASPIPLEIVETRILTEIFNQKFVGIGCGGGGIPVIRKSNGELVGVEAVIDKDRTSALLANTLGVEQFVILTNIDGAYLNFNSEQPRLIKKVSAAQMETYIQKGEFSEGNMKPKAEAVVEFVKKGGKKAIIAHLDSLIPAMEGKTGTHVTLN